MRITKTKILKKKSAVCFSTFLKWFRLQPIAERLITLCLKRLLDISRLTTVSVKLFLYMPQLANEIEQNGIKFMTVIHS